MTGETASQQIAEADWDSVRAATTRFDQVFSGTPVPQRSLIPQGNAGAEHIGPEDTWRRRGPRAASARLRTPAIFN